MKKYIFLLSFCVACGGAKVIYDYDTTAAFDSYKSYNYPPEHNTNLSQLDEKRLYYQLDSVLQSRGYTQAATPDFYVHIVAEQYEEDNRNALGVGIGSGGRNVGVGVSGGIPIGGIQLRQQLTVDFVDSQKNAMFWQAVSDDRVSKAIQSPSKREQFYRETVAKILSNYPPQIK